MRMFTVDSSNKYVLKIEEIKKVEDAGDDFTTEEELREMLGISDSDKHFYVTSVTYNKELIAREISSWVARIPQGKNSIVCTDAMLIEAIKEGAMIGYPLSSFVSGLRRLDNKFIINNAQKVRKTNKNDYARLLSVMVWSINRRKKYQLEIKYSANDRAGSLELLKKLISWDEIKWDGIRADDEDKEHMKKIWDNPTMFDKEGDVADRVD